MSLVSLFVLADEKLNHTCSQLLKEHLRPVGHYIHFSLFPPELVSLSAFSLQFSISYYMGDPSFESEAGLKQDLFH